MNETQSKAKLSICEILRTNDVTRIKTQEVPCKRQV